MPEDLQSEISQLKSLLESMEDELGHLNTREDQINQMLTQMYDQLETGSLADEGRLLQERIRTILSDQK